MQTVAGQESGQPAEARARQDRAELIVSVGGYVLLFVLGILQGLIGTFQYSRALGSVPVGAVAFALLIGVTCVLGAWGMHRPLGGLLPGVGWLLTSLLLARGTAGGSVLITNTAAGQWFLFGGTVCTAAGVVTGFVRWSPRRTAVAATGEPRRPLFPLSRGILLPPDRVNGDESGQGARSQNPHKPDQ